MPKKKEMVEHPAHYNVPGSIEVIDFIESWSLDFNEGNVVKYVTRHKHKSDALEDLKKARFYIDRLIALQERQQG
jgi:hypothetical protein|tara:strand:+ start:188 stop:412 length:225 start_codon:yes stop_codon:yes gene_type:complete